MPAFLPIPAIDLIDGQVVRLARGRAEAKTVYSNDPAAVARSFEEAGATRLHLVDLDGAFCGEPRNLPAIMAIRAAITIPIELGGGLRSREAIARVFDLGIDYAILGTGAVDNQEMLAEVANEWGDRLIVGIDAHDGRVAVAGWTETSDMLALDFARSLEQLGIGTVIYTDIATDGMLSGPNLGQLAQLADATIMEVIASGGVSGYDDLDRLRRLEKPNLIGAIIGRAIYERRLDLRDAVARLAAPIGATPPSR